MTLQSYADKASYAVGDDTTPSKAVADVVKGQGLNREKISRICTLLNIKLLERDKSSAYTKRSGRLWQSRWPTAKPGEVYDMLGMTMQDVPGNIKESGYRDPHAVTKLSSLTLREQLSGILSSPIQPPTIKLSSNIGVPDPVVTQREQHQQDVKVVSDLQDMIMAASDANQMAHVKIAAATLMVEATRAALLDEILQTSKEGGEDGFTLGEALYAVKHSCPSQDAFVTIVSDVIEHERIDPKAAMGWSLTDEGEWNTGHIKQSQAHFDVRLHRLVDDMTGRVVLDQTSGLVKKSKAFGESVEELRNVIDVQKRLEAMHGEWSRQAHTALFS